MDADKNRFEEHKKTLEDHLQKFHSLRKEGKLREAMEQYSKTIEYARTSINHSLKVLNNSISKIKSLDPDQQDRINKIATDTASSLGSRDIIKDLIKDTVFYRSDD